jgi:hypothetical protein
MSEVSQPENNLPQWAKSVKNFVFGPQNERIEYLIDNFFRLTPESRAALALSGVVALVVMCCLIVVGYFSILKKFDNYLDESYTALQNLQVLQYQHARSKGSFSQLKNMIDSSTRNFVFITYVDQKSKELGLEATNFPAQPPRTSFPANHPLYGSYQIEDLTFDVTGISLKQLVDYLVILQSVSPFMALKTLRMRSSLQSKSFLDVRVGLQAIVPMSS